MKRIALALLALCISVAPAESARRFNKSAWQVPQYIQTHTKPYTHRVAVVYPHVFLTGAGAGSDTDKLNFLKAFNTRMGTLIQGLKDAGAEVHVYDTMTLMDSTSSGSDAAGEQAQPIWNGWGTEYPVTLMVGFRSQYDGTLADRRPFFKAYSTTTQMIHLVFNSGGSLYDDAGTASNQNCGTGAFTFSLQSPANGAAARVCLYGAGERDTVYGNSVTFVNRVPDSTKNADIHSVVRLFKPIPGEFTNTTGAFPSGDDSVAGSGELMPLAFRTYHKVPGTSTKGRHVDYVLMGGSSDNEAICWQHIAAALVMRYTKIPPLKVGWVDVDDNGNWGSGAVHGTINSIRREQWPSNARMDSLLARGQDRWGVVWNLNGPIDSMIAYRNSGFSYLGRARYMTHHSHDTVATRIYGNVFGKGNTNADTNYAGLHSHRWAMKYNANSFEVDRHTDAGTRDLGMYWRLRDHANKVRANFQTASGSGYLNVPGADCLPLDWRSWGPAPMTANHTGYGYCPPDSFFLAWTRAGIHTLACGFEIDYQADTTYGGGYAHNTARTTGLTATGATTRKWFTYGNESYTVPSGTTPEGRDIVTGEERTIRNALWLSVSEVTPQSVTQRQNISTKFVNSMLGLRRTTWIRPNVRYNVGETGIPAADGSQIARARNTDIVGRVATTGLHGRYFVDAGTANNFGDWDNLTRVLNHLSAMNGLAGRPAYRFVEPWRTFPGVSE